MGAACLQAASAAYTLADDRAQPASDEAKPIADPATSAPAQDKPAADPATPTPAQDKSAPDPATPPAGQEKPAPAQEPAAGAQEKPAPDAAASQPSAAPADETPHRSLFEETWHQFQFGGRATSIKGDPARFQRYQDVRDGVLFSDARYALTSAEGDWLWRAAADNVGYLDQRYVADYQRTGRFKFTGLWDQIPQFYSVDTATAYTHTGDNLALDDATQRLVQNGQGNLSSWIRSLRSSSSRNAATLARASLVGDAEAAARSDGHLHDEPARG